MRWRVPSNASAPGKRKSRPLDRWFLEHRPTRAPRLTRMVRAGFFRRAGFGRGILSGVPIRDAAMSTITFDAHKFVRKLQEAGFDKRRPRV